MSKIQNKDNRAVEDKNFVITLTTEDKKPFNENDLKKEFIKIKTPSEVTSIPSPFAQLHLFNMAFFAANAYRSEAHKKEVYERGTGEYLYDKLISHCLDIFELLFYWDELHLDQKGFEIADFSIPNTKNLKANLLSEGGNREKHINFRETLDLYIDRYKKNIKEKSAVSLTDAFDCGYYIKYQGEIIAVTSPLTGFFISASSNFGVEGICNIWDKDERIVYLSEDSKKFRHLANRNLEFRIFMCKFIDGFCPKGYTYFNDYISEYFKAFKVSTEYKTNEDKIDLAKYGFSPDQTTLQLIKNQKIKPDKEIGTKKKSNDDGVIVIPDRYNKIYFRSLVEVKTILMNNKLEVVHFTLTPKDYEQNIDSRMLLGEQTKWLSVDDFFQPTIAVLHDAVNEERFYCCEVFDKNNNKTDAKILLPLKEKYFKFLTFNGEDNTNLIEKRLSVKIVNDEKYVATLKVPTAIGEIALKKEYVVTEDNSTIVDLDDHSLYLGVYPFVKDSVNIENNGFFRIFTYHSMKITSDLHFYKDIPSGVKIINEAIKKPFSFHCENDRFPVSTFYALEKRSYYKDPKEGHTVSKEKETDFDIIKVNLKHNKTNVEALIIPRFVQKPCTSKGILSVDFGTSNTNVSLGVDDAVTEYDSFVGNEQSNQISQMVMLNKPVEGSFDFEKVFSEYQFNFLCEFMPTDMSKKHKNFKFAIPSILNLRSGNQVNSQSVSLVDSNIPIAYYSEGLRKLPNKKIDIPVQNFKWLERKSHNEVYAYLFIDQLLFMARNWFLARGQNPQEVEVVYSTPLSMNKEDSKFYKELWKALFNKYFSGNNAKLRNISESRAPYYATKIDFKGGSSILLDVGGGSTDILFYNNSEVKATTSYAYAANHLFGKEKSKNIFMKLMPATTSENENSTCLNVEEDLDMKACDIFNYRFAQKQSAVSNEYSKHSEWQFLLALHCSAILYHAIQNNRAINGKDVILKNIMLSGNGAKLFKLLADDNINKLSQLAQKITKFVYGEKNTALAIYFVEDENAWVDKAGTIDNKVRMKAATSVGGICWQMDLKQDKGVADNSKVIPIGYDLELKTQKQGNETESTQQGDIKEQAKRKDVLYENDWTNEATLANYRVDKKDAKDFIIKKITENFNHFLTGFLGGEKGKEQKNSLFDYGLRTFVATPPDKDKIWEIVKIKNLIESSIEDHFVDYPEPAHSIFFVPIERLIIKLSEYFTDNVKEKE